MEKKFLEEVNKIAAEAKRVYDEKGFNDVEYKRLMNEIYGALRCLKAATGKDYCINPDATVTER